MAIRATGQITIIDYNDALTLSGFIGANKQKTQMFNPDNNSYNPDWSVSPFMVLTPSLFKLGNGNNIITDPTESANIVSLDWYDITNGIETLITASGTYVILATGARTLTIKTNILAGLPGKEIMCKIVYKDPSTLLNLIYKTSISLSRVVNGGGITDAIVWAPEGNVFKNSAIATLPLKSELWRGSTIDITAVTYQWYKQDASVTTDQGGGVGWFKLTNANGYAGVTTNTLTVPVGGVDSYASYKCIIKDTDSASNTYNQSFMDVISIIDNTDPYQVVVTSTGGDVFKNGVGSTTLTAKVYQGGIEIDSAGMTFTYKWYKYNKDGTLVTGWGGTGINFKTGKTLAVGDADVEVKATFMIEIE